MGTMFPRMTDRELVTLTAALLAARRRRFDPDTAVAEAFRLWYLTGGVAPTQPEETAADHVRNALQIFAATEGLTLDAPDLAAVRRRLMQALAALEPPQGGTR